MKKIECIIMDWAGTAVDYGCFAPVAAFVESFKAIGAPVTAAETRAHMGLTKIEEVRALFAIDHVQADFRAKYGRDWNEDDVQACYKKFQGELFATLEDYSEPITGVVDTIAKLRADGYYLAIASCKPQYQCIPICEHFHLDTMVDGIYGASEDNSRLDKDQVIRWAFQHIDFDENAGDKALMVGDRWTDADGAKACGLDCLGCGWGYAEPGELKAHGAYRILDSVDELAQAVEEYFA